MQLAMQLIVLATLSCRRLKGPHSNVENIPNEIGKHLWKKT